MNQQPQPKLIDGVLRYWPLIVGIVMVIGGWYNANSVSASQTERIAKLEAQAIKSLDSQNQIQVQLAQIQTDVLWIKQKLK